MADHDRDPDLEPARPQEEGVPAPDPDAAHNEGAHVLANEAAPRLEHQGFSREQVLEWAEAFLAERGGGTADDLVEWVSHKEGRGGD